MAKDAGRPRAIGREQITPLPQPEPGLTPHMVVARAKALQPILFEQQAENDLRGFYSDEIHQAMRAGGLYRILQPKLFGGYEFDYPTFIKVILALAEGHPSSAWCYTLASSHTFLLASHWPAEAQARMYGQEGEVRVCQRATPAGTLVRAPGGWIVDGTFGFASGAPVSTHFIGSVMVQDGEGPAATKHFVVAREHYEVVDDWAGGVALGMQGSGSNSVRLDHVFLPEDQVIEADFMMSSAAYNEGSPGVRLHGNPMYIGVGAGAFLSEFGAITTGAARAAITEYQRLLELTPLPRSGGRTRREDPEAWRALGKAMNLADAAEAVTFSAVDQFMEQVERWAADRTPILPKDTLKLWGMAQEASELACQAVDLLFITAGPRAFLQGQRMQRYFRDIQAYRIHTTAQPQWAMMRAQAHLGMLGR